MRMQRIVEVTALCLAMTAFRETHADLVSLLGEQDYADGTLVTSNVAWLNAQSNESAPFNVIYSTPATISYTHTGLDAGISGVLTLSLWDLDAVDPGNQVSDFSLDGIAQSVSGFDTSEADLSVKVFQFPVAGNLLADGQVSVSLSLVVPNANEVGIDFSRLEVSVPEPSALWVMLLPALFRLRLSRRRSAHVR